MNLTEGALVSFNEGQGMTKVHPTHNMLQRVCLLFLAPSLHCVFTPKPPNINCALRSDSALNHLYYLCSFYERQSIDWEYPLWPLVVEHTVKDIPACQSGPEFPCCKLHNRVLLSLKPVFDVGRDKYVLQMYIVFVSHYLSTTSSTYILLIARRQRRGRSWRFWLL